jgi:hypothetical protein
MQITILSATKEQGTSKTGKPYNYVELAYKDTEGKVSGRKIMSFGDSRPVYELLSKASPGEHYKINLVKNEGSGYWDWTAAAKADDNEPTTGGGSLPAAPRAGGGKVVGSNYETAEERAKRQVYIVRQSSITAALNFLNNKAKSVSEVLQIAKEFENYVFDTGKAPVAEILEIENDIPM